MNKAKSKDTTAGRKGPKSIQTTKKRKRKKSRPKLTLKEFIPNYREFQKEAARLEAMLGPDASPDAILDLPEGMNRQWAQDAWPIVKANAELNFRPSKPGTELPFGVYADRAMWALLVVYESPFNDKLRSLAISQIIKVALMEEKVFNRRIRAEKKAAKAAAATLLD